MILIPQMTSHANKRPAVSSPSTRRMKKPPRKSFVEETPVQDGPLEDTEEDERDTTELGDEERCTGSEACGEEQSEERESINSSDNYRR